MDNENQVLKKPKPFDSFDTVYKILVGVGCYKLLEKPSNKLKLYCHNFYRLMCFGFIILLNVQQMSFIILSGEDVVTLLDVLATEIPQINLIIKFLTAFYKTSRIDKLNEVMNGPYFTARGSKDEEYLNQNKTEMNKLMKMISIGTMLCASVWLVAHFLKKLQGEHVALAFYIPLDSETWIGFSIAVLLRVCLSAYLGLGHLALDVVVVTYYSQVAVQLKMIKYNLEHMFDEDLTELTPDDGQAFVYRDVKDKRLRETLVYNVQKYGKLVWFTRDVTSVFNFMMTFQFLTATATTCFVIYTMSNTPRLSAQFVFLVALLFMFQTQVFLYCYYGNLVEYESQSICQSAFMSDWTRVSPSLRRGLIIAMIRWTQPLRIRVSVVIPLSITTSIQIARLAYTLFTLLSTSTTTTD